MLAPDMAVEVGMTGSGAIAVTGASRGIGAGIACELARRGRRVACLTRSGEPPAVDGLDPAAAERLRGYRCDVTDAAGLRTVLDRVARDAGGLAGLVNNAGILEMGPSESFPLDDMRRILETNTVAVLAAAQAAHPHFVAAGGGVIVNIGSFWDRVGAKHGTAYAASKAAVGAITRCLAVEWAPKRIWVYNVAPGFIATDMNKDARDAGKFLAWLEKRVPVGRPGSVDEVARLVAALFDENLPFLTGETIVIDGAQSINQ